jgi:hypothetical protein
MPPPEGWEKHRKLEDSSAGRAEATGREVRRDSARFLTGRPVNVVVMTFITHEFSRGPWTSAVQGLFFETFFLEVGEGGGQRDSSEKHPTGNTPLYSCARRV